MYNTYSKLINTSKHSKGCKSPAVPLSDCHVTFINVVILVSQFSRTFISVPKAPLVTILLSLNFIFCECLLLIEMILVFLGTTGVRRLRAI